MARTTKRGRAAASSEQTAMPRKEGTARRGRQQPTKTAAKTVKAAGSSTVDVEALRAIVELVEKSDITRLEWSRGDEKLIIRRGHAPVYAAPAAPAPAYAPPPPPAPAAPAAAAPAAEAEAKPRAEPKGQVITSPFVGTFYRAPSPESPPFVEVNALVKKGQVLCIVEAMKLMNEIESEIDGKVVEIFVENGHTVEFGQPLFRIEPMR